MAKRQAAVEKGGDMEMIDESKQNDEDAVERLFGIDMESTVENSEIEEPK